MTRAGGISSAAYFFLPTREVGLGLGLAGLVVDDEPGLGGRHPAVGGDEVAVVLHRLGPVVHQVLVDVVGVEQRGVLEAGEQRLGDGLDQGLGVAVLGKAAQVRGVGGLPLREQLGGGGVEGGELGVAEDGGLDVGGRDAKLAVAGAAGRLEQRGAHGGEDLPVGAQGVEVAVGDAAAQVGVDVLQVLGLGAVDVARQVEVVVVLRRR